MKPPSLLPPPAPAHITRPQPPLPLWAAFGESALVWVLAAAGPAAAAAVGEGTWSAALSGPVLALIVVGSLVAGHGYTPWDLLGVMPTWALTPPHRPRWNPWWATLVWALLIVATAPATYALLLLFAPTSLPPVAVFAAYSPWTLPVVAGVTGALLGVARCPAPVAYLVVTGAAVAAAALPFGWGAVAVAPAAVGLTWLFLRTRLLTPLLVASTALTLGAVIGGGR